MILRNFLLYIVILCCAISTDVIADEHDSQQLLFSPLLASPFEARLGYVYEASDDKMRLDIGHSLDVLTLMSDSSNSVTLGADMMTWTRLRSAGSFKFPVETTDFYFGFNSAWKCELDAGSLVSRFRLAHISSHIVDGYEGERVPFTYSREFVEVHARFTPTASPVSAYVGSQILFSTIPDGFNVFTPQVGIEYVHSLSHQFHVVAAYDFRLASSLSAEVGTHAAVLGLNIGTLNQPHIRLQALWYKGLSFHGMFFDDIDSYAGVATYFVF